MQAFFESFGGMALGILGAGLPSSWRASAAPRARVWPARQAQDF
jgi:hypothetical protein